MANAAGGPGRYPVPTIIKELTGSEKIKKTEKEVQKAAARTPVSKEPPYDMSRKEKQFYKHLVDNVDPRLLALADQDTFIAYVEVCCERREISKKINKTWYMRDVPIDYPKGYVRKPHDLEYRTEINPLIKARHDLITRMLALAVQLGFTPASRARLVLPPEEDSKADDPWAGLSEGKKAA